MGARAVWSTEGPFNPCIIIECGDRTEFKGHACFLTWRGRRRAWHTYTHTHIRRSASASYPPITSHAVYDFWGSHPSSIIFSLSDLNFTHRGHIARCGLASLRTLHVLMSWTIIISLLVPSTSLLVSLTAHESCTDIYIIL